MSYPPQQPGNWSDPSWPTAQPGYPDPSYPVSGQPVNPVNKDGYPVSGYPASGYPAYGYPPMMAPPTNGLAIAAMVCALAGLLTCISAPIGAILGHVARKQIRERGEAGEGFAMAGIIVGWILTGIGVLVIAFYVFIIVLAVNSSSTSTY